MTSEAQTAEAARVAEALTVAQPKQRRALVEREAERLGVSAATLYRWMQPFRGRRKRRSDDLSRKIAARSAHPTGLTEQEAHDIAAVIHAGTRATGKRIMSLGLAVESLRNQGIVRAERVDRATGEAMPLSLSAISRGLRAWSLHWEQQKQATPHQPIRTEHPNARWEVDASVCVLYYLPEGAAIQSVDRAIHYKNKPEQLARIAPARVIRYVLTDHATGVLRWRYYPHAESGAHTLAFLAWCMAPKADERADPFHGAPFRLVADPGATASSAVRRYCDLLGIELAVTQPHNPRAKGSVEKGQDLVETWFESGLRFQSQRILSIDDLNQLAERVQIRINNTRIHHRTGATRFAAWMRIRPEELRRTEGEAALRALATERPATPRVKGDLTVAYRGATWDVRAVPGLNIGERIDVAWCPLVGEGESGHAVAIHVDLASGETKYLPLPRIERDAFGFRADAPVDGREYASIADTPADKARKRLALAASDAKTQEAAEAARKHSDFRPLAHWDEGRGFDPYLASETEPPVTWLPRRGTEHKATASAEQVMLDLVAAAQRLATAAREAGGRWGPERYAWLAGRYPDGVPEGAMVALEEEVRSLKFEVRSVGERHGAV